MGNTRAIPVAEGLEAGSARPGKTLEATTALNEYSEMIPSSGGALGLIWLVARRRCSPLLHRVGLCHPFRRSAVEEGYNFTWFNHENHNSFVTTWPPAIPSTSFDPKKYILIQQNMKSCIF